MTRQEAYDIAIYELQSKYIDLKYCLTTKEGDITEAKKRDLIDLQDAIKILKEERSCNVLHERNMTAIDLLKQKLAEIGADGLYCDTREPCGCGLDDFMPCGECGNLDNCVPAKWVGDSFYPMKGV